VTAWTARLVVQLGEALLDELLLWVDIGVGASLRRYWTNSRIGSSCMPSESIEVSGFLAACTAWDSVEAPPCPCWLWVVAWR